MLNKKTGYKIVIFEFKKFLRDNNAFFKYINQSRFLRQRRKLWDLFPTHEPIELIQSAECFCVWGPEDFKFWRKLSNSWAKICLDKGLYYNNEKASEYYRGWIEER